MGLEDPDEVNQTRIFGLHNTEPETNNYDHSIPPGFAPILSNQVDLEDQNDTAIPCTESEKENLDQSTDDESTSNQSKHVMCYLCMQLCI